MKGPTVRTVKRMSAMDRHDQAQRHEHPDTGVETVDGEVESSGRRQRWPPARV